MFTANTQKKQKFPILDDVIDITPFRGYTINENRLDKSKVVELLDFIKKHSNVSYRDVSWFKGMLDDDRIFQPRAEDTAKQIIDKVLTRMNDNGSENAQPIIIFEKLKDGLDWVVDGKTTIVCATRSTKVTKLPFKTIPKKTWEKYSKREIHNAIQLLNPEEIVLKNPSSLATCVEFLYNQFTKYGQEADSQETKDWIELQGLDSKQQDKVLNQLKLRIKETNLLTGEGKTLIDYSSSEAWTKRKVDEFKKESSGKKRFPHIQSSKSATVMKSIRAATKAGYNKVHIGIYASDVDTALLSREDFENSKGMKEFLWEVAWHKIHTSSFKITWEKLDSFRTQKYRQ